MSLSRAILIASGVLLASAAPYAAAQAPQQMPCMNEIVPLRQAVEKDGQMVKAIIDRKAPREEICNGLKRFTATEAKFVKYLEANATFCGIPPEALKQVKAGHSNTVKMRGQACSAGPAAGRPGPAPGPGLSDALGTTRAPVQTDSKTDRGTYNTLTGNPFQR